MAVLTVAPAAQKYFDSDGIAPLASGKVYTYSAGTTTPLATYSDAAGSTPNANPITLDANGQALIYVTAGTAYDFVIKRPDGTQVGVTQRVKADGGDSLRTDLASASSGYGIGLVAWPTGQSITQTANNQHFSQNGAAIHRIGDRFLFGAATANDGAFPNVTKDWLSTFQTAAGLGAGTLLSSQVAVLNGSNANSAVPLLSGVQSLNFTSAGTSALANAAYAVNNNATLATQAWAFYCEAHRTTSAAGETYAMEVDTRTLTSSISANPYAQGDVVGIQIASGCGLNATGQFDASAAIQIAGNPKRFKVGINFYNDALTDLGGGVYEAMAVPSGSIIRNWINSTTSGSYIYFATTTAAASPSLKMANSLFEVTETTGGAAQFRVNCATGTANYPSVTASATGSPIVYGANGSDTNIDIALTPKGTGNIRMGTWTSNADAAINGYVTIKDSGGTTRKLATIA